MSPTTATASPPRSVPPADLSRVEGVLHRALDADLFIRSDSSDAADDGLLRLDLVASSEEPYLRAGCFEDPWVEILGHKPGEVDLSRLQNGAPLMANHDREKAVGATPLAAIGVVEKAWLDHGKVRATVVVSRREALADLRQDIADGLVKKVSLAYYINKRVLLRDHGGAAPNEFRVTEWLPFEISLVDIPADDTVGVGRSVDAPAPYQIIPIPAIARRDIPPAEGITARTPMENTTVPPAEGQTRTATILSISDALTADRERIAEIHAIAEAHGAQHLAQKAIQSGQSADAFGRQILAGLVDSGKLRLAESPEIGMSEKEIQSFSFLRAIEAARDPHRARDIAPFEIECSRAAQDKRGDSRKEREGALTIPADVLSRGLIVRASEMSAAIRGVLSRAARGSQLGQQFVRDLTVGTPTAGGNLVATELLGTDFIALLRNAMVLDQMGATFLRDLNGNLAIPSHTATTTGYWVAENGAPTEAQPTVGQVTLSPKTVAAWCDYSRRLTLQSSIDVEAFVRADLAANLAQMIQIAAINGSGSSNQPTGVLNAAGIGSVAGGTNGLAPDWTHIVGLETLVSVANANLGSLGYLTNAKVRGKLLTTQKFASTNGEPVWGEAQTAGEGRLRGYAAYVTNAVPSDLTKGSSSGICSAIAFGNWQDLLVGFWGGLDILVDPYSQSTTGGKRITAFQDCDIAVRRAASFAAMKDALTT